MLLLAMGAWLATRLGATDGLVGLQVARALRHHRHLPRDGVYGAWGWRGLTAYFAGFAAEIPFMVLPSIGGFTRYPG